MEEKDIEKLEQQMLENNKKGFFDKYVCPKCGSFNVKIGMTGIGFSGKSGVVSCTCKECGHVGKNFVTTDK